MKNKNIKIGAWLSALAKVAIVVLTIISVSSFFTDGGEGNMVVTGWTGFIFYTTLSNVFSALCALVTLPVTLREAMTGERSQSKWAYMLDMVSANVITITLLVVLFFLGIVMGYDSMFAGCNLFMHLITPLLAIAVFIFQSRAVNVDGSFWRLPVWSALICIVPTFAYEVVYAFQVLIAPQLGLKGWSDFYMFNTNGLWYVFAIVISGGAFGIAMLLRFLKNKVIKY